MLIAVTSDNTDLVGAIVYWRLSGDVHGDDLNCALVERGLSKDDAVGLPTPRAALRRALAEYIAGDVFQRAGRGDDGALYLVRQLHGEGRPQFEPWVRANLTLGGMPKIEVMTEHGYETQPLSKEIAARYWHHVMHASTTDIGRWLIEQAAKCDAVSLRDTGGVYFIPRHQIDAWRLRADALAENTASRVYMIPAMNSDEAFDAVIQGLLDEAESLTTALQADLTEGEIGARAFEGRARKAQALIDKLSRFEALLGPIAAGKLAEVRDSIEQQRINALQAALACEAEKAGA